MEKLFMEKLFIKDDVVMNLPGDEGPNSRMVDCTTSEQFAAWCNGGDGMACRYKDQVYVKVPQSLDENGEFSLDYDCIPLDEANNRIERWNTRQLK